MLQVCLDPPVWIGCPVIQVSLHSSLWIRCLLLRVSLDPPAWIGCLVLQVCSDPPVWLPMACWLLRQWCELQLLPVLRLMQPHKVWGLFAQMRQKGLAPSAITYCASTDARERAKQPHKAMELRYGMLQKDLVPASSHGAPSSVL